MAILGIDEVGRGPLAGPLVVGAVILPEVWPEWVTGLRDSKKLTAKKRAELSEVILAEAPATGLGWVTPEELDAMGISEALRLATRRAVKEVQRQRVGFSQVMIDGKVNFLKGTALEKYVSTAIKADDLIKEVSAASIIAKVARDNYMKELAVEFPGYGFEKNAGYGTAAHLKAIRELGISPIHRKSFEPIKSMVGFERGGDDLVNVVKNTTSIGRRGETAVCEYLSGLGHKIVARNFRTRLYEIDIVSIRDGEVYFTEVKTRSDTSRGGGLYAIDVKKMKRMEFAAESFLKHYTEYRQYDPKLAVADVNGDFEVQTWFSIENS